MYSEEEFLPISALEHLCFCERQVAFIHVEGLWQDNLYTAEGSILHQKVHQSTHESRADTRIARGLWLRSFKLGLCGKTDLIEFKRINKKGEGAITLSGISGWWRPFPVEYKRGRLRSEISYEIQLCAQGICLEEMLGISIDYGALYFGKTNRRLEIALSVDLRNKTQIAANRLHEIVRLSITPPAKKSSRCRFCSMVNLCLPGLTRKTDIEAYIKHSLNSIDQK